jgi:flagellar motor switch protein FliN
MGKAAVQDTTGTGPGKEPGAPGDKLRQLKSHVGHREVRRALDAALKAEPQATGEASAPEGTAAATGRTEATALLDAFLEGFLDPARGGLDALTGRSVKLAATTGEWGAPSLDGDGAWAWAEVALGPGRDAPGGGGGARGARGARGAGAAGAAGAGEAALALAMPARDAVMLCELVAGGAPEAAEKAAELDAGALESLNDGLGQVLVAAAVEALKGAGGFSAGDVRWRGVRQLTAAELGARFGEQSGFLGVELAWDAGGPGGRMFLALSPGAVAILEAAGGGEAAAGDRGVLVQPVRFQPIGGGAGPAARRNIDLVVDIPLQITVELGRTTRRIKDILSLSPGAVVELDKLAGEAVDILVNGRLIARGEVVVIDENFGVRITDIVSPAERVSGL